jgi:hypothetical protein
MYGVRVHTTYLINQYVLEYTLITKRALTVVLLTAV